MGRIIFLILWQPLETEIGIEIDITGGVLKVKTVEGTKEFDFDCTLSNGKKVTGQYKGNLIKNSSLGFLNHKTHKHRVYGSFFIEFKEWLRLLFSYI